MAVPQGRSALPAGSPVHVRAKNPPSFGNGCKPSFAMILSDSLINETSKPQLDSVRAKGWNLLGARVSAKIWRLCAERLILTASPMTPAAYLDKHASDLLALVRDLVRVPTVNPPGVRYDEVTLKLAAELSALGLKAKRWTVPAALAKKVLPPELQPYPRYNVLGFWPVGAKKTVHFNAHYDVVPVSGEWAHKDPFSGAVDGGWIYGRGTADMKGSIASLIFALKALRETGLSPRMNVEVSFTADEETDSLLGSGWVVEHAPIKPDYAVV